MGKKSMVTVGRPATARGTGPASAPARRPVVAAGSAELFGPTFRTKPRRSKSGPLNTINATCQGGRADGCGICPSLRRGYQRHVKKHARRGVEFMTGSGCCWFLTSTLRGGDVASDHWIDWMDHLVGAQMPPSAQVRPTETGKSITSKVL